MRGLNGGVPLIIVNGMDERLLIDNFGMTGILLPWRDESFRDMPYQYWISSESIYG